MDKTISFAKEKLNKFLIISILLSIGFGQLTRIDLPSIPAFYVHDLLVPIFILFNLEKAPKIFTDKLFKPFSVFVLLNLLSHLLSSTLFSVGILYLLRLIIYFVFYLTIRSTIIVFRKIPAMLLSGFITLLIGTMQYLLLPDTRYLKFLGWDDHLNRIIFPHFDPTYTSIILGLFFLLALSKNRLFLAGISVPVILLTYARSTFISLFVVLIAKYKRLIPLIAVVVILIPFLPRKFGEGTNLLRTYSVSDRISHDLNVLDLGLSHPVLGVGYNNVATYLYGSYSEANHATSANNSLIQVFATSGLLGLATLLYLATIIYRNSQYKPSLLFLALSSLFNNTLFYPFTLLWIIILDGLKVSKKE